MTRDDDKKPRRVGYAAQTRNGSIMGFYCTREEAEKEWPNLEVVEVWEDADDAR